MTSRRKKGVLKRRIGNRGLPKPTFLIVCEGEKTEPNYFKSFKLTTANYVIEHRGFNTDRLIQEVISLVEERKKYQSYDQVWVVFDKDDNSHHQFNRALQIAANNNISVAYSNEAFEIWYLLHFNYYNTALSRRDYIARLNRLLDEAYQKNSMTMYEELLPQQSNAINNAIRLLNSYQNTVPPANANPSTTVHLLVNELNKYI